MLEDVNYINNNYYYNHPQQNQGWNQQRPNYSGNYSGNYKGHNSYNNNNNYPPLRKLVSNQGKLMDNLSMKLALNDKMLENINNRMDNFSTGIKNQISFNKMIESQLNQIAAVVPATNLGILLGILNITTKSRLNFLILVTVPKMPNLSLTPLKPSCHP